MLHKAPRLLEELEQSLLLDRREDIPYRCGLTCKRPKGWDAYCGFLFRSRRNIAEYAPCSLLKITRKPIMPSRAKPKLLPWGRQIDLFSLIRNPNPFKVKTGTRPRAAHEVPLLTATASRVIDMEDPTVASGSSGTPSTVERSPLDFDNED
ncbi:hypothetical protein Tco_1162046 [Tanacetum coccineum]